MRIKKRPIIITLAALLTIMIITVYGDRIHIIPRKTLAALGIGSDSFSKTPINKERGENPEHDVDDGSLKESSSSEEHDEHAHSLNINPVDAANVGITMEQAGPREIKYFLELPGEVGLNEDRVCHVAPHVSGTIAESGKNLGDSVKKGEIIAVIDSRELAEAKSRYLVHLKREELAKMDYDRIENLWRKNVSSEKEYLDAKQKLEEMRIERMAAAQKLFALGLSKEAVTALSGNPNDPMMRYHLTAPLHGTIITKHMTRGEWAPQNKEILCIADLSDVWVNVIVYPKYLPSIKVGQKATVKADASDLTATGTVSYIGPIVGEETRTAQARIVISNPDGNWRPGLFATVKVLLGHKPATVAVHNEAIQYHNKLPILFIPKRDNFEIRNITLGLKDKDFTEVVKGVSLGEKYAAANSFALKAELERSGAVCGHSH